MLIYLARNKVNGKVYIGKWQQPDVNRRWSIHVWYAKNRKVAKSHLHSAVRKYGEDAFTLEILQKNVKSSEELCELEKKYILQYKSYLPEIGYNMTMGGEDGARTEEMKKKVSKTLKAREFVPTKAWTEARRRTRGIPQPHRGRPLSEENKKKKSEAAKKYWATKSKLARRERMAPAIESLGTEDWKKKLSQAQVENWKDPEYRKKTVEAQRKGWKKIAKDPRRRQEINQKFSKAQTRRWAARKKAA
jgi:group I intron endonuclease